jgi:hypothetical protein
MDNRHLSYIFKFLKKNTELHELLFLMYSRTVRYPRHVLRCSGYMTPNGYVTDGRTDGLRASVRPPTPTFCLPVFSLLLLGSCVHVRCCCIAVLLCCCVFFPSSCRVSSLPVGVLRLGLTTFFSFPLNRVNLFACFFS